MIGRLKVRDRVLAPAAGLVPGYGQATSHTAVGMGHDLSMPAEQVRYTFRFEIVDATAIRTAGYVDGGGTSAYVEARVSAWHGGCLDEPCNAVAQAILVSIDEEAGISSLSDPFTLTLELRNPIGDPLPPGRVQLVAEVIGQASLGTHDPVGDSGEIRGQATIDLERIEFEIL